MADNQEQLFIGSAKIKPYKDGQIIQISISLDQLNDLKGSGSYKKATKEGKDGKKYLSIVAFPLKTPTEYRSHSVKLDTFEPQKAVSVVKEEIKPNNDDDLPF